MKRILASLWLATLWLPLIAFGITTSTPPTAENWPLKRDTTTIGNPFQDALSCWTAASAHAEAQRKSGNYSCGTSFARITYTAAPTVVCPAAPAASQPVTCTTGTGTWTQTRTVTANSNPATVAACYTVGAWSPTTAPAGACVTTPPPTGPTVYFSPAGNDTAAGTQAAPKRMVTNAMITAAAPGTSFLFQCGPDHLVPATLNPFNAGSTAASPITFGKYGTCAQATLRWSATLGLVFGSFRNDGNYAAAPLNGGFVFQDLRIVGNGGTAGGQNWGLWLVGNVRDVTLQNVEVSGWYTGINGQPGAPNQNIRVIGGSIRDNPGMGILGMFNNSLFDGVSFTGNNAVGSTFVHSIYLGNGNGNVIRGVTVDSPNACTGGTITAHGLIDGLTIENVRIKYGPGASDGCWPISVNPYVGQGVNGFRNLIIRGNDITNAGGCAICVKAAPGALIEGNRSRLTFDRWHQAVSYDDDNEVPANLRGPGTVRNNTACLQALPAGGSTSGYFGSSAGSTVTNNVVLIGAAATTGACAP